MLSALFAIATAAPSGIYHHDAPLAYETIVSVQPELRQVGAIINHVPTAVSHQSRTDYHSKPVVKSVLAPIKYIRETVHQAPAVAISSPAVYATAHHSLPTVYASHHDGPYAHSSQSIISHSALSHGLVHSNYAAPLIQSW